MKVSTIHPPFSQGVGIINRRGCRRLSVVTVALVRRFDSVFTKHLADFGVFPKQLVYPRVEAQHVNRLCLPFLAGFSDSLPPFVYEGKHDSPSFLRGDQNRNRGYRKRRQRRPD